MLLVFGAWWRKSHITHTVIFRRYYLLDKRQFKKFYCRWRLFLCFCVPHYLNKLFHSNHMSVSIETWKKLVVIFLLKLWQLMIRDDLRNIISTGIPCIDPWRKSQTTFDYLKVLKLNYYSWYSRSTLFI